MKKTTEKKVCLVCRHEAMLIFRYVKDYKYFRCSNCKLVSTYPFPTKKEIEKHYERRYKKGNYELLQRFSSSYISVYQDFANKIEKLIGKGKLKKKTILDIGCFTGEFLETLQKKGAVVYGLELQNEAVRIANKKLPGRILKGDIMSAKLGNKKFDIITMIGLIEHVTDPVLLIKRCKNLLNKNGIVFIQTPNSTSFFARVLGKYWPPYAPVEHIHLFSRESLNLLLKKNKFSRIHFQQSWKKLPVGYVFNMLQNFGPELFRFVKPLSRIYNSKRVQLRLPFYVGEMIITAKKK